MGKFLAESALVCAGGALGACVRWAVADMLAPGFLLAIFLCNVISRPKIKKFHTVGICGGLTTFSTFSLQVAELVSQGNFLSASLLFLGTFAACLAAAQLSFIIARRHLIKREAA